MWKFKAELEKDINQLDSKEYEAKKAGLDDKELLKKKKKKKAVMPKLQASGVLGWAAPVHLLFNCVWAAQPHCACLYVCSECAWDAFQDALTSLTTLLKKPKFKTEEVSDSMGKALQALQAAKPIKASLQKALKKPD